MILTDYELQLADAKYTLEQKIQMEVRRVFDLTELVKAGLNSMKRLIILYEKYGELEKLKLLKVFQDSLPFIDKVPGYEKENFVKTIVNMRLPLTDCTCMVNLINNYTCVMNYLSYLEEYDEKLYANYCYKYIENYSIKDLMRVLDKPEPTVKRNSREAREALERIIREKIVNSDLKPTAYIRYEEKLKRINEANDF